MITSLLFAADNYNEIRVKDRLDKPFTLVYAITWHDLRSKEVKDAILARDVAKLQMRVNANDMTKQDMEISLARERQEMAETVRKGAITISYDGRTLLANFSPEPGVGPHAELLRDNHTFHLSPEPSGTSVAGMGYAPLYLEKLPIVGPSLPHIPIQRDGRVLCLIGAPDGTSTDPNRFTYLPGEIRRGPNGAVASVWWGYSGMKQQAYSLSEPMDFEGTKLATNISFTRYAAAGVVGGGRPTERCDYVLARADTQAMDPSAFDAENYLPEGAGVFIECADGSHKQFMYRKSRGSFAEQEANAEQGAQ